MHQLSCLLAQALTLPHYLAVYSGCSSYNPATFQGNIAAGCWPPINVAVRPNGALYTSEAGDVAVAADGYELLAAGQDVLYKDPSMDR